MFEEDPAEDELLVEQPEQDTTAIVEKQDSVFFDVRVDAIHRSRSRQRPTIRTLGAGPTLPSATYQ